MLRHLYRLAIRLHPTAFRGRFGGEMLSIFDSTHATSAQLRLLSDCLVSSMRQWILRPGSWTEASAIDNNTWDMILGKAGKLPGELDQEIIRIATEQHKEFYSGVPQDAYPDELDKYRNEMAEKNWELGQDEEELFELAMHDKQYRDYKSGIAKTRFEAELAKAKEIEEGAKVAPVPPEPAPVKEKPVEVIPKVLDPDIREITAPAKGQVIYNLYGEDTEFSTPGEHISKGDRLCYIQTSAYIGEILCPYHGVVSEIVVHQGVQVKKGEVLFRIRETRGQGDKEKGSTKKKV